MEGENSGGGGGGSGADTREGGAGVAVFRRRLFKLPVKEGPVGQAKDVVPIIEGLENLYRDYTNLIEKEVGENLRILHLRQIVPESINIKMDTIDLHTFQQNNDLHTIIVRSLIFIPQTNTYHKILADISDYPSENQWI